MRKKVIITMLMLLIAICCATGLTACNGNSEGRSEHLPTDQLIYDEYTHWYKCKVEGCDDQWNHSGHNFENGVCVCGAIFIENLENHEHVWSKTWKNDEYKHWHTCNFEGCAEINDRTTHDFSNGDCPCGWELYNFTLNEDYQSYTLTGVAGRKNYDHEITINSITIPETYKGKKVTAIGKDAFRNCQGFTSVTIPDGITSIGSRAFLDCFSFKNVTIPDSVTSFGEEAFGYNIENATGPARAMPTLCNFVLKTVTVTSGDSIDNQAFANTDLSSITLPDTIKSIGEEAFSGCLSLTSITIPASVTTIGEEAFCGCSSLTSITIPASVTTIGKGAFYYCTSLTSITIPDNVKKIGAFAFRGCTSLVDITISDSTHIGEYAFLETAWFNNQPDGLVYLGNHFYTYKGDMPENTSVTIKEGTKTIADYAFLYCSTLTSITIPDSVIYIGDMYGESKSDECHIVSATIPAIAAKEINNSKLKTVTITSGQRIDEFAFSGCSELTNVTIPDSVMYIGSNAFYGCTSLENITIPDSVYSIGYSAFDGTAWYKNQPDGIVYAGKVVYKYKGDKSNAVSITLRDDTKGIASFAFSNCNQLTSITIPDSVLEIGRYAFSNCTELTNITIGSGVKYIENSAFENCTKLKTINFNGTREQWNDISKGNSWNGNMNILVNFKSEN